MARFGRGFLQAATQPAYLGGLFTAAQNIGAAPARQRAAQQQASLDKGLFGLEQMALSGELTPEMYKEAVGSYTQLMRQNPQASQEIRESLGRVGASVRQQSKQQSQIAAKTKLENLKQAAVAVQMSELSPQQKQENLARFRVEAQKIIDDNPNVDLTAYATFSDDVEASAYQLDKLKTTQATTTAVESFSNQLFQIKDYETLQTTSDTLLKANPEYAEEIKKLVDVQQTSIENREKRERAEEERKYDMTGSVTGLRKRAEEIPDLAEGVRKGALDKLKVAEGIQKKHKNNTGWTNTLARDRARELIRSAEEDIDNYFGRVASDNMIQLRGVDNELQTLIAKGPKSIEFKDVEEEAEGMSLTKTGKELSDLSSRERKKYMDEARTELSAKYEAAHNSALATLRARRASITGEKPEEPVKTEKEDPKFIDPISKEAVEAAKARGQSNAQIRRSLQALGASNEKIIELLFD